MLETFSIRSLANKSLSIKPLAVLVLLTQLTACSFASMSLFVVNSLAVVGDYIYRANIAYGPKAKQQLDIYQLKSEKIKSPAAVVIFYYGGCWGACTDFDKADYRFVAEALVDQHTLVVIPDYQQYPAALFAGIMQDTAMVVSWVGKNIADYGGDPNRIFLMGHSSGAHLASMLTLNEDYLSVTSQQQIKGFIGLAGPYDFLPFTKPYQPQLFGPESRYAESQPVNFVDGNEAPMLLLYGGEDDIVGARNIINLSAKVTAAGGRVVTRTYPGLSHAGILAALSIPFRSNTTVKEDIEQFISANP